LAGFSQYGGRLPLTGVSSDLYSIAQLMDRRCRDRNVQACWGSAGRSPKATRPTFSSTARSDDTTHDQQAW